MKRKPVAITFGILTALVIVFLSGPRVPVDTSLTPVVLPQDLELYLRQKESRCADITPGTGATIIWADSLHNKTDLSVVYLHGFSATRYEIAPLCDSVAAALHANLYYPRLTGHGQTGAALAAATVNDWCNDVAEALAIGSRLGERVVLVGMSNGGALATWIATRPEGRDIAALILISPNFGLKDKKAGLLLTPWARYTIPLLVGKESGFTPFNDLHARYWTSRYPTTALLPMMGMLKLVRTCRPSAITAPVMVLYSPRDRVLDVSGVEDFFRKLTTVNKRILPVEKTGNSECHVIAGVILSPETTLPLAREITAFVRSTTTIRQ